MTLNRVTLTSIFGTALWIASAIEVLGFTWEALQQTYQQFPGVGGSQAGDFPTVAKGPKKQKPRKPKFPPKLRPNPVPAVPPMPRPKPVTPPTSTLPEPGGIPDVPGVPSPGVGFPPPWEIPFGLA